MGTKRRTWLRASSINCNCHPTHTGLDEGETYFYQVAASPSGPWSSQLSFTTFRRKPKFPFRIGYMGDVGNSLNATVTVSIHARWLQD
jgi:hypothetical protein